MITRYKSLTLLLFAAAFLAILADVQVAQSDDPTYVQDLHGENGLASPSPLLWHMERIDRDYEVNWASSLVLDSNGYPHLSYEMYGTYLLYAFWNGEEWVIDQVDNMAGNGRNMLVLDSAGHPHISYMDCFMYGCNSKYAHWTGDKWSIEGVEVSGSIALDSHDYAHIVGAGKHMHWDGSKWHTEILDAGGQRDGSSIVMDSNDIPHIVWYAGNKLKYWSGIEQMVEIIDDDVGPGGYPIGFSSSMAIDTDDRPHISYNTAFNYDLRRANLKYAVRSEDGWTVQIIDGSEDVGSDNSLRLDTRDYPHVSYRDNQNNIVKYAWWDGTSWLFSTISSDVSPASTTSLVLDDKDFPSVAFYRYVSSSDEGLILATGEWLSYQVYLPVIANGK